MYHYKGDRNIDALYDFVTEGYKSASDKTIPPAPSAWAQHVHEFRRWFEDMTKDNPHLKFFLEDVDHIASYRKNAAAFLLGLGAFIGFVFGVVVSMLMGTGTKTTA